MITIIQVDDSEANVKPKIVTETKTLSPPSYQLSTKSIVVYGVNEPGAFVCLFICLFVCFYIFFGKWKKGKKRETKLKRKESKHFF